jgi:ElaB/YqjD/DUF883 family membrane-anchored ribosome-binding protein
MKTWVTVICLMIASQALGQDGFTPADRDRMIRMETRLEETGKRLDDLRIDTNKRFEELRSDTNRRFDEMRADTNKRFEELRADMNKRFELVDKRFEQVNQRFDDIVSLMTAIVSAFAGVVIMTIGFALWDRWTMIRPVKKRVERVEETLATDRDMLHKLIDALRKLSLEDDRLASVLKSFSLL